METTPAQVISYFNGEKQYLIPLFQRQYRWEKDSWATLWEDVMVQYEQYQPESESAHFMGAIVSVPAVSVPVGVTKYLVIDGQQRLVTISILLAALRDALKKDDPGSSQRIQNLFLTNQYAKDEDNRLKIVPTNLDRELYRKIMYDENFQEQEELMVGAYKFFVNKLTSKATDDEDDLINPSRVLEVLEKSLQVVMINLGDKDDPYLIFESLNFKGQPLTQADLVRNYILMKFRHSIGAGGEQDEIHRLYWKPIEESLGDNITDFLWYYVRRNGKNVLVKGLYTELKSIIENLDNTEDIKEEIKRVKRHAEYFKQVISPDTSTEKGRRLKTLNDLKVTTAYPFLLKLFEKQHENKMDDDGMLACLKWIESFVIRRSICGIPTNALNKLFLSWCAQIPEANFDSWLWKTMSEGTRSKAFPNDAELEKAFVEYAQYKKPTCKHVLWALEESFQHKEEAANTALITIEHVMPQELSTQWKEYLGKNWNTIHTNYLDTFGNLTLTGFNSELSNSTFDEKKRRYADSHFELTLQIARTEHWTKDEIESRARMLAQRAISLWAGPKPHGHYE